MVSRMEGKATGFFNADPNSRSTSFFGVGALDLAVLDELSKLKRKVGGETNGRGTGEWGERKEGMGKREGNSMNIRTQPPWRKSE